MNFINDNFLSSIKSNAEYEKALESLKEETLKFGNSFHDDPKRKSNWGHQYFCNDDGGRLIFDVNKPKEHVCCVCNKVYKDEPYDGVWTYMYRNEAIATALKAAVIYKATGDKDYLGIAVKIIGFYSNNYSKFILHNKEDHIFDSLDDMEWGCGKIMPQGLNESIICVRIIQTLEIIKEKDTESFIESVKSNLLLPMVDLLKPQVNQIHNIRVWNLAALGSIALFVEDSQLYSWCYDSEFGIKAQLEKGVTVDGFWYEGSIFYNFFLLEGMVTLLLLSEVYGTPFEENEKNIIAHMLERAYMYTFDNQYFPNPNDGWPDINLKTFSYIYHMASRVFGEDSKLGNIVKIIESGNMERTTLPLSQSIYSKNGIAIERLMFNCDFDYSSFVEMKKESYNFEKSNFAMLRDEKMNLFMKYGLNGRSHAHPDILNVEVCYGDTRISRDISNAGYQSTLCNKWHRVSLAHNTVVCDGENIPSTTVGEAKLENNTIAAAHKDVYPNIDYKRSCKVNPNGFEDTFSVVSDNKKPKDYVFHVEGDFKSATPFDFVSNCNLGYENNGYEYIKQLAEVDFKNSSFNFSNGAVEIELSFEGPADGVLYFTKTMDNPVNKTRNTFIFRSLKENPVFKMKLNCKEI